MPIYIIQSELCKNINTFEKNTNISCNCKQDCLLSKAGMNYEATRAGVENKPWHKELVSGPKNINFAPSVFADWLQASRVWYVCLDGVLTALCSDKHWFKSSYDGAIICHASLMPEGGLTGRINSFWLFLQHWLTKRAAWPLHHLCLFTREWQLTNKSM